MTKAVHAPLEHSLPRHADREAIVAHCRPSLSYAELGRQLARDHEFLRSTRFRALARIGVALPQGAAASVVTTAIATSGACATLKTDLEVSALEHLMKAMRIDGVAVSESASMRSAPAIPPERQRSSSRVRLDSEWTRATRSWRRRALRPATIEPLFALVTATLKKPSVRAHLEQSHYHLIDTQPEQFVPLVAEPVDHYRRLMQQAGTL